MATAVCAALLACSAASAQWSTDPLSNLNVADKTGEQTQVKLAPTDDGGTYVGWFDNSTGGFDVYLQKLDVDGNELWAHNGVLVADRGFSSTQDWDLDVDTNGNALLAFRDDRFSGTQITAAKVDSAGNIAWAVQFTDGTAFVAAPKIAGTTDGKVVVAWTQDSDVKVQKLNADGTDDWAMPTTMTNFSAADMDAADNGSVILSMIQGFIGATYWTQKIDTSGNQVWNSGSPAQVFSGALQIGNFPQFVTDGSGGGVYGWYGTGPLQCYAQRVDSAGSALFASGGAVGSTDGSQLRVSPSVAYNSATGETFLFWTELNSTQSQQGVSGQKFDASGNRQWTDTGIVIAPLDPNEAHSFVMTEAVAGGAIVTWIQSQGFGTDEIVAARVDTDGNFVWLGDIVALASFESNKGRLTTALSTCDFLIAAWADDRNDANDILVQNVDYDGALGPVDVTADLNGDCAVDVFDLLDLLAGWGSDGPGADLDKPNDVVDVFDLLVLLANWG